MNIKYSVTTLMAAVSFSMSAWAGGDHDHGAAPASSGLALPRFFAVSEAFELVGVVNGKQVTLYLDRFADNRPVKDARLELDIGGKKVEAKPHADGEYEATLAQELQPGVVAVTATVTAGTETDLLAGDLDIHVDTHAERPHAHGWWEWAGWAAGAAALLLGLTVIWMRRARPGGAA